MATAALARHHAAAQHQLPKNGWASGFFFLSECFLFGALISSRYYLQRYQKPEEVNQHLGLAITGVLLLSSLSAHGQRR